MPVVPSEKVDDAGRPCPRCCRTAPRRSGCAPIPATAAPKSEPAWETGWRCRAASCRTSAASGSPSKAKTSPGARILAGRGDHRMWCWPPPPRRRTALARRVGVGQGEGRQQVAEGRARWDRHRTGTTAPSPGPVSELPGAPIEQVIADRRDRRAELVAGRWIRVGEDVDQLAVGIQSWCGRRRWVRRRRGDTAPGWSDEEGPSSNGAPIAALPATEATDAPNPSPGVGAANVTGGVNARGTNAGGTSLTVIEAVAVLIAAESVVNGRA